MSSGTTKRVGDTLQRRGVTWALLTALAFGFQVSWTAPAQDRTIPDDPGDIPIPESEPDWHCPIRTGASISQGNGGSESHTDDYNKYAWDYDVPSGTPVVAARSGVVEECFLLSNIGGPDAAYAEDANRIRIRHSDGTASGYFHLSKNGALVRPGEFVLQGELIGYSGATGSVTDPHLHFGVVKNGISTPIRFSDFEANDGVPKRGHGHGKPSPPRVPQALLTEYKRHYRACLAAEERDWPDIGIELLRKAPRRTKYSSYYYDRVLEAFERRFLDRSTEMVGDLLKSESLNTQDRLLLARLLSSLKSTKTLKKDLARLAAKQKQILEEERKAAKPSGGSIKALRRAMKLECSEEYAQSGTLYLSVHRKKEVACGEFPLEQFRRVIHRYRDSFQEKLERLKDEADRCLPKDRPVVRRDTEQVAKTFISLASEWRKHVLEDRQEAEELLVHVEKVYRGVMEKTSR